VSVVFTGTHHRATEHQLPCGITQCYLLPDPPSLNPQKLLQNSFECCNFFCQLTDSITLIFLQLRFCQILVTTVIIVNFQVFLVFSIFVTINLGELCLGSRGFTVAPFGALFLRTFTSVLSSAVLAKSKLFL